MIKEIIKLLKLRRNVRKIDKMQKRIFEISMEREELMIWYRTEDGKLRMEMGYILEELEKEVTKC